MTTWLKLAAAAITLLLAASVFLAWRAAQKQQFALQAELKTTQQALADATAREATRDASLNTLMAQLKKEKTEVQTTAQLLQALPQILPLPAPIVAQPSSNTITGAAEKGKSSATADAPAPKLDFPAADLKPLYDFAVDCKSCQAQLAASQADLKDERAKEQALSRERDDALRAAKGGSVFRRLARAAKWFAIGAAAGAIAAKAAR